MVKEGHQHILSALPQNTKLSIALDCWTSPFQQAFMAITGYFIDKEWNYRELLLGFEPLHGSHTGMNLSSVLASVLEQHSIVNRVLAITTDNASNNITLIESLQKYLESLERADKAVVVRIPCLAHVIQLCLKELLGLVKANPKNDNPDQVWSDAQTKLLGIDQEQGIVYTLKKV
jgi:hypothetical protein